MCWLLERPDTISFVQNCFGCWPLFHFIHHISWTERGNLSLPFLRNCKSDTSLFISNLHQYIAIYLIIITLWQHANYWTSGLNIIRIRQQYDKCSCLDDDGAFLICAFLRKTQIDCLSKAKKSVVGPCSTWRAGRLDQDILLVCGLAGKFSIP